MPITLQTMEHDDLDPPPPVLDSLCVGWSAGAATLGWGGAPLSLFDYKEHGVVDVVPTRISTRTTRSTHHGRALAPVGVGSPDLHFLQRPLPALGGPHVLVRPLGDGGINNNNKPYR